MEQLETVSIKEAARVLRKPETVVRAQIEQGKLPIGEVRRGKVTKAFPQGKRICVVYRDALSAYVQRIKEGSI